MRKAYQSDLSDAEWGSLERHLPAPEATGRPPYEQGIRKASRDERGVRICSYDAFDGEAFG